MTSFLRIRPSLVVGAFLAALLLLVCASPAFADMGSFMNSLARRDRVIQICVIVMLLALFIMLKKMGR